MTLTYIQHFRKCCRVENSVHVVHSIQLQYVGIVSIMAKCLDVFLLKDRHQNKVRNNLTRVTDLIK